MAKAFPLETILSQRINFWKKLFWNHITHPIVCKIIFLFLPYTFFYSDSFLIFLFFHFYKFPNILLFFFYISILFYFIFYYGYFYLLLLNLNLRAMDGARVKPGVNVRRYASSLEHLLNLRTKWVRLKQLLAMF